MASVEQREASHPASLTTLEMFDKYKELDEDKDSDEESFHLTLLDSEEDLASSNKTTDTPVHNGETEEDILNKFDCNTPDAVDPKVEESILNEEIEDENSEVNTTVIENKTDKDETEGEGSNKTEAVNSDITENGSTECSQKSDVENDKETQNPDNQEEISANVDNKDIEKDLTLNGSNESPVRNEDAAMELEEVAKNDDTLANEGTLCSKVSTEESTQNNEILGESNLNKEMEVDVAVEEKHEEETDQSKTQETVMEIDENLPKPNKLPENTDNSIEVEQEKITENTEDHKIHGEIGNESSVAVGTVGINKNCEDDNKIDETGKIETDNSNNVAENLKDTIVDDQNVTDNELRKEKTNEISSSHSDNVTDNTNKIEEDSTDKSVVETASVTSQEDGKSSDKSEVSEEREESSKKDTECDLEKNDVTANESAESQTLERDDLLDISVICDVDEDNAKAVAENASDGQISEKSDNDDQDDKVENDIEESENDQEENLCPSDKDDAMEFEDCASNSNLQFEDNSSTNDNVAVSNVNEKINSDSLDSIGSNKEDVEMVDVLPKVIAGLAKTSLDRVVEKIRTDEEKTENETESNLSAPEEPVEYLDLDKHMAEQKKVLETTQAGKRPLPSEDNQETITKKIRLSESPSRDENLKKIDSEEKLKTLSSFETYMRTKLFNKKLTKSDLEQFCIQKICEVIMHKTELGELHQMYRKQEQVIEVLRKDIQQLTKQARDLDIVNKKLMNEIKTFNGKQKPLVPLKITRSVGLQVKLNLNNDQNRKRTPSTPNRVSSASTVGTPPVNNRQRTITPNNNAVRQITSNGSSPRKPQSAPNSTTPILSQALQTPASRQSTTPVNTAKRSPQIIRPKTTETAKPSNPGVIDLTDEDDRSSKSSVSTPVKILGKQVVTSKMVPTKTVGKSPNIGPNKMVNIGQVKTGQVLKQGTPTRTVTTLPQGVRLTPTGVKNGIAIPASVVTSSTGGAQLMYVVQPTSSLVTTTAQGGQKTVLLNFQPGNGILTSAINGSAVSVIPTKANVQVKAAPAARKHPAPLPLPPPVQPNNNLKPLLPKPHLSIRKTETGIILQWRMPYNLDSYECIASYQLFAYQETNAPPSTDMWRKVGDVKALALPMACTLTQFADKNKYYFAVRSVDVHKRIGAFSDPEEISL